MGNWWKSVTGTTDSTKGKGNPDQTYADAGQDEFGYASELPDVNFALTAQHRADAKAARRNDMLARQAGATQREGLGNLQTYRPGGASALTSGYYNNLSNILLDRRTDAPDLLGKYREFKEAAARKAAKKAAMMGQAGGSLGGAGQEALAQTRGKEASDLSNKTATSNNSSPGGQLQMSGGGSPTAPSGGAQGATMAPGGGGGQQAAQSGAQPAQISGGAQSGSSLAGGVGAAAGGAGAGSASGVLGGAGAGAAAQGASGAGAGAGGAGSGAAGAAGALGAISAVDALSAKPSSYLPDTVAESYAAENGGTAAVNDIIENTSYTKYAGGDFVDSGFIEHEDMAIDGDTAQLFRLQDSNTGATSPMPVNFEHNPGMAELRDQY